jgi:drug/metabolite transporter (DMT)-like permease
MSSHPRGSSTPSPPSSSHLRTRQNVTNPTSLWSALVIVYVVWGSTYYAIKVVAESLPTFGPPALRFGVAGLILAAGLTLRKGIRVLRITWRQLGSSVVVGILLLGAANGLVVLAESPGYSFPSGVASLVIALVPLILVVFRAFTGDRPSRRTIAGLALGLVGLAVLFLPGSAGGGSIPLLGGLLLLVSALTWATGSFAPRWLSMHPNPFVSSVYQMLAGAAVLALVAVIRREPAPWGVPDVPVSAWIAMAYLVIFGSLVAYTAYVWLLQNARISLVSTYAYVNPVVALAFGTIFAHETLSLRVIGAAATVLAGVALVVSTERPRTSAGPVALEEA